MLKRWRATWTEHRSSMLASTEERLDLDYVLEFAHFRNMHVKPLDYIYMYVYMYLSVRVSVHTFTVLQLFAINEGQCIG